MGIQVSTVVTFTDEVDASEYKFSVELDDVLNGDKTTFHVSESAYLITNQSSNVTITEIALSDGTILSLGSVSRSGSATNSFTSRDASEPDTYELSVAPSSVNVSYIGKAGSLQEQVTDSGVYVYTPNVSVTPFVAKFDYDYNCTSYRLTPPPGLTIPEGEDSYEISVVFYLTVS